MNISLDQQIRKDKQKQRHNHSKHHKNQKHNQRVIPSYIYQNRYEHNNDNTFNYRQYNQTRQHREPRILININNLHYSVTRQQLQQLCESFGKLKSCRIEWDKMGRSNQKATVQYFNRSDAENALNKLKDTVFEQQKLQVQLVQDDSMPAKRHEIRKNYGNRYRNHNYKSAGNWYK